MIKRGTYHVATTQKESQKPLPDFEVIGSDDCSDITETIVIDSSYKPSDNNESFVQAAPKSGCVTVKELYLKTKILCDNLFFSSIRTDQFISFTNSALRDFWEIESGGWNFTLSDYYEIPLQGNKCAYELPSDFSHLSYVSVNKVSSCMPTRRIFQVVDYSQWDTSLNSYTSAYKYDPYKDRALLFLRLPCMTNCNQGICDTNVPLSGSVYVRYYTTPPEVYTFDDKICQVPRRWGAHEILAEMIAMRIHAQKGRPYQNTASFNQLLHRLKQKDRGDIIKNPVKRKNPLNFKISR